MGGEGRSIGPRHLEPRYGSLTPEGALPLGKHHVETSQPGPEEAKDGVRLPGALRAAPHWGNPPESEAAMGLHPGYPKSWPVQVTCTTEDLATSRPFTPACLLLLQHTTRPRPPGPGPSLQQEPPPPSRSALRGPMGSALHWPLV